MEVLVLNDFTSKEAVWVDMVKNVCAEIGPRHKIVWFNLHSLDMKPCIRCFKCRPCGECVLSEDDAHKVSRKLFAADALIIGMNSSLGDLSCPFVVLLNRCINAVTFENESAEIRPWRAGRPAVIISREKNESLTAKSIQDDDMINYPILRVLDAGGFKLTDALARYLEEDVSPAKAPDMPESEKRAEERIDAGVLVQVLLENKAPFKEFCVNLSAGGLFLESENLLPEDTPLRLRFELPDSRLINCKGRVAWVNEPRNRVCENLPPGMGIQFQDLHPECMNALRNFIKKKAILPAW